MVSEILARFLAERVSHCFTVSGAGNIRILNALSKTPIQIISCHHEQACAQASIAYYRVSGRVAPVVVTCGGGASNVVTGIVSAWMDSIPLFVIAGQESRRNERLRAYGVQGFDLITMVERQTKFSRFELTEDGFRGSWEEMLINRPGPVLIEIPMDVQ